MRRTLVLLGLLVAGSVGISDALACGDKFLVGNSGARYMRPENNVQPGNVVIYAVGVEDWDAKREALSQAGNTVVVTGAIDEFWELVRQQNVNVAMLPAEDARAHRDDLVSISPDLVVLPYVEFGSRSELSETKREFGRVLQTPATVKKVNTAVYKSLAFAQK